MATAETTKQTDEMVKVQTTISPKAERAIKRGAPKGVRLWSAQTRWALETLAEQLVAPKAR